MKYCMNCGAPLADDSNFCGQCGATQQAAAPQQPVTPPQPVYQQPVASQQPVYQQPVYQQPVAPQQPVYQQPVYQQPVAPQQPVYQQQPTYAEPVPKGPNFFEKNKALINKIGWIAAAAVLVVAILFNWVFPWLGTLRYNKMAKAMADAYYSGDYSGLAKFIPDEAVEENGWDDVDEYIDYRNDSGEDTYENLEEEYGKGFSYSVKVSHVLKYPKDQKKDEIESIAEDLDVSKKDIKDVVKVFYVIKVKGDDTVQRTNSFTAYKYDGKWYIDTYISDHDDY